MASPINDLLQALNVSAYTELEAYFTHLFTYEDWDAGNGSIMRQLTREELIPILIQTLTNMVNQGGYSLTEGSASIPEGSFNIPVPGGNGDSLNDYAKFVKVFYN